MARWNENDNHKKDEHFLKATLHDKSVSSKVMFYFLKHRIISKKFIEQRIHIAKPLHHLVSWTWPWSNLIQEMQPFAVSQISWSKNHRAAYKNRKTCFSSSSTCLISGLSGNTRETLRGTPQPVPLCIIVGKRTKTNTPPKRTTAYGGESGSSFILALKWSGDRPPDCAVVVVVFAFDWFMVVLVVGHWVWFLFYGWNGEVLSYLKSTLIWWHSNIENIGVGKNDKNIY